MNKFWNIPNVLSLIRLLLVPVFLIVFFFETSDYHIGALIVFLVASFTDVLDGIIARKTNQITKYGVVLDPLADKLLKMATLIAFAVVDIIPVWLVATLITIDLALIITGVCLFKRKITIPSNFLGKLGTFVMSIGLVLCFFAKSMNGWNLYILYAGLIIIVASVIVYIVLNYKRVFNKNKDDKVVREATATKIQESDQQIEKTTSETVEVESEDVIQEATATKVEDKQKDKA